MVRRSAMTSLSKKFIYSQLPPIHGTWFFADACDGSDGRSGNDPDAPLSTLLATYNKCTTGRGDGIALFSRGISGTAYEYTMDAALAWTKYGITMVGIGAELSFFNRVKLLATTADLASMITLSGRNNEWRNICISNEGTANTCLNTLIVSGHRNKFKHCHINDGASTVPAAVANCSGLDLRVSECEFEQCTFGSNGTAHTPSTGVNAPIMFSTAAQGQNLFKDCRILSKSNDNGRGGINIQGAATMNGWTEFDNCVFLNFNAAGGPTTLTSVVVGDAQNDCGIFLHNCGFAGWADWCGAGRNGIVADGAIGVDMSGKGYEQNPS